MSSFIRDKDAHTRGVNAIAAVDGASGRLRHIEAIKARRMALRDQALARMAKNGFRPMLGAIPTKIVGGPGSGGGGGGRTTTRFRLPGDIVKQTIVGSGTLTPVPGFGKMPGTPAGGGLVSGGLVSGGGNTIVGGTSLFPPGTLISPGSASVPGAATTPTSSSTATGYGVSGGGAAGPGGMPGLTPDDGSLTATDTSPDTSTDITDTSTDTSTTDTSVMAPTKPNYLLYAGLALGAYLLWSSSRKG